MLNFISFFLQKINRIFNLHKYFATYICILCNMLFYLYFLQNTKHLILYDKISFITQN